MSADVLHEHCKHYADWPPKCPDCGWTGECEPPECPEYDNHANSGVPEPYGDPGDGLPCQGICCDCGAARE